MTIFRGPGGTGSATSDVDTTEFQEFLVQSQAARDAASSSASTATTQASNAAASATAAAGSASSASTSATNAANSASSASTSASSAATSATNAASSATAAASSATAAAASAASINPADIVHISGTETITGAKTFSQTITGSITGNAGTATNGVVTTGSYANPTWITSLAGSKVSGDISGNAANVTGTVPVANGGTGSTTTSAARTALGVTIGSDVQAYSPNLATYASTGIGFRNRIINGDMRIAQRGTASVNTNAAFPVDRFAQIMGTGVITSVQSAVAPAGFTNSLFATVTTADTTLAAGAQYALRQTIEGFNMADLGWGTAGAQPVTISFWVRSSITGTYSVSLRNSATNRSYIATYVVNAANTLEYKTVTVPGDSTGTWLTGNGVGVYLQWTLGGNSAYDGTAGAWSATNTFKTSDSVSWIGTNAATFYITGVQLEAGSVATPFERRDYGRELMMCQRYYEVQSAKTYITYTPGGVDSILYGSWAVEKRASPTLTLSAATQIDTASAGASATKSWIAGRASGGTSNAYCATTIAGSSEL